MASLISSYIVIVILVGAPAGLATPMVTHAQQGGSITVPAPVIDLFNTFSKINVRTEGMPIAQDAAERLRTLQDEAGRKSALTDLRNLWDTADQWLSRNIGVSGRDMTRAVGGFFVWTLELLMRLIKEGLSKL